MIVAIHVIILVIHFIINVKCLVNTNLLWEHTYNPVYDT